MAELSVTRRMQAIEKLAVDDDDGAWDAGEIRMLAEAAKERHADTFAPEGVEYLTALYKSPDARFVGAGKQTLLDVLVQQARVDRAALAAPGEPIELRYQVGNSDKFYRLAVEGTELQITYGRTGTEGQRQLKKHPTHTAALKAYDKKLAEKLREGYTAGAAAAPDAPAPAVAPIVKPEQYSIRELDYGEVEQLIQRVYGVEYETVASEEWSNDSQHRFTVEKKPLDRWEQESFDSWKAGNGESYILGSILQDLCNRGHLEPGKYLITVCW